ncbi:MAG: hypothetical protein LBK43_04570 [Treponema sp.]|nr:hypothetical protein [Treponema sp.]
MEVFVNAAMSEIRSLMTDRVITWVQLHGTEDMYPAGWKPEATKTGPRCSVWSSGFRKAGLHTTNRE